MLKLISVLVLIFTFGVGNVWGVEEVIYTLEPASGSNNSYTGNCDVEIDDITWNVSGNSQQQPWRIGGKSITSVDRAVYSKTAMNDAITKIELTVGTASNITVNSLKLIVASDAEFNTKIDEVSKTFAASSTISFTPSSPKTEWQTGAYYKFVFNVTVSGNSNKYVEFSKAEFYAEATPAIPFTITLMDDSQQLTEASAGSGVTLPSREGCSGYTFAGWTKSWVAEQSSWTTTAPTIIPAGSYTPTANENLYPVYTKKEGGGSSNVTFTPGTDTGETSVTKSGVTCTMTTMNNASYYQIYGSQSGTFSVASGNITAISFTCTESGTTKYGPGNASANVGTYSYSGSTGSWEGSASSVTISSSAQIRMTALSITCSGGSTTYYISKPNCCEPLASIKGSVELSQEAEGSHAGELKAAWQLEGTTGIGTLQMQLWKKGSPDTQVGDAADVTINTSAQTKYYSGLDHCATYYVKLVATKDAGTYCTNGWTEQSNEVTTIGYSIATNPVGGGLSLSPNKSIACAGDAITITANSPDGSHEGPATIVVTDGESNDITTSVLSGSTLTMPSSDITITATYAEKTSPSVGVSVAALDFESPKKGASVDAQTFSLTGSALEAGTLTLVAPSGYTVSPNSIDVAAGALSAQTITVTPSTENAGTFNGNISISGAGVEETNIVALTMTVQETYTVNWYVNGSLEHTQTNVANTDYDEVPSDFSAFDDCKDGLTFIGWSETAFGSTTSAPSLANIGSAISAANKNYYAVFAEGTPGSTNKLFEETFASCAGTGGNDDTWSGNIGTSTINTDVSGWTTENAGGASSCIKAGTGSKAGSATSPSFSITGNGKLYFRAGAFGSDNTTINLTATGATLGTSSVSPAASQWSSYEVDITEATGSVQITFTASATSNQRFFLDDVLVTQTVAANWTKWYTTCPHYYTISLTNNGIVDGKGSFVADKASALAGESVKLTATGTENAGRFNSWNITGLDSYSATTNPLTITMPDNDITVSATFDALYAIQKDEQNGTITLGADYAAAGDEVTISASANPQYKNPVLTVFETATPANIINVSDGKFTMPACGVTARVVCEPAIEPLDAPVLGTEEPTYQGVTLNWTGVSGNEGYVLTVYKNEVAVEGFVDVAIAKNATSYEIASGLAANTAYTYSIYTKGDGETTLVVNTPAEGSFTTDEYPFVHVTYSENGVTSNANTSAEPVAGRQLEHEFALPSSVSNECTKVFVGWTDDSPYVHGTSDFYAPSANYTIHTNEDVTLYAVYATETPGDEIWTETAISALTASDVVVIVGDNNNENGPFAMTNDNGTSSAPAVSAVTVSGSNLTGTIAANIRWNISKDQDNYTIYPNGTTETWLYCTNTNNGVRVGTGDAKQFTINQGYLYETATNDNRFIGIYNSQDWRCYAESNGNPHSNIAGQTFKYYKRGTADPTYSGHAITCTGKVQTPTFSGVTDSETYEENKTVSLACETTGATIRYTMSNDGTTPADPTGESTAATSISLNADGVYVIKAKAFKDGMDASDVATISVTINKPCTTIAEFIAAAPASDKKLVFTAESNAVVLGVNANRIYIQDPTGGLLLYKNTHEKTWTKGKKVVGTIIGTYALTDDSPRMLVTDFGETAATIDGEIPSAVVIEGAINTENFAANRNKLVTISDLHFQAQSVGSGNSINITRGDDTYQIYNAFNALNDHVLPLTETACSVTGILGYHSNKYQLMPIDANCITTGAPAVLPEFVGETGGADAEHPTEVASGEVIKLTAAEGMTTTYQIGENAPVSVTTNTEAVISGSNEDLIAITISASREYYATNSVTYYYKINNALTKYIITSAVAENGTFKVKNSDASAEITSAVAGATVTLVAEPTHTETAQYSLDHWTVYETGNTSNTVSVENNQFIMPSFAVTVSATFAEDAYATVVFDGGDATGTAPASEKKYVGQEVTMPNKGALVKADNVLASWTYNETEYAVGDTYEIQAGDAAIGGKDITFTANWTPYPWANGGDWMLVTDAAEVTAGSYVIIAAAASNVAISTTQNSNNRAQQSISKTDNRLTYTTAPAIFEVRAGNIENTLAFYDVVKEGYIYAAGGGNYLRTQDDLSNQSSWNIEITNAGEATILANDVTQNSLRYNDNNSLFSCYASGQKAIALYKYYAPVPKVTYDKNTEDEVTNMPNPSVQRAENNKATIATGPSRTGYTFEGWKNGNTTYTVGEEYTFTEDITLYAQWEALPSFHVTYNTSGSQGTTPTDATNYYEGDPVTLASASGLSNAGYFFDQWVATYVDNNSETQTLVIEDGKFTMPAFNVTVTATWARKSSDKWIKVTATSQLTTGKEYIIVNTDATYAVGAQNNNNRAAAAIEENNGILTISDAVAKFTLGIPEENKYTFYQNGTVDNVDKGYLYAAASDKNYIRTQVENNDNGVWTISIGEGGAATITATGEYTRNIMRYNSTSKIFSCYGSGQSPVVLYYKAPKIEINNNESVNVSDAAGSDIVIHDGGTLVVNEAATIGDLTVEAGGKVVLDENKLTVVGTFTIETTMASGESGQLNGATASNFEAGEVYFDITLGANGTNQQWHAFTVPFPVDVMSGIYDKEDNKLTNEVNYAIMEYHGDERAKGNYGWKKIRTTLVPGTFYIMATDGYRTTYRFKKKAGAALVAANSKPIYEYPLNGGTEADKDNGWNGLGNPNLFYGKVDLAVQVLDPESYTYVTKTANSTNFVVGTPFFYQAAAAGTMVMETADAGANYAPARVQANEIKDVPVSFGNEDFTDYLYISANEDALSTYETGKDLVKMTMTSTPKVAQIFGSAYGNKLCMVHAPMVDDQASYALSLYAPADGTYHIETPTENEDATLYLTKDGRVMWNLSMSACEVELTKGTTENYGLLLVRKAPGVATGMENVQSDNVQCTKVIIDNQVFILRGGQMYDVTGKAVK